MPNKDSKAYSIKFNPEKDADVIAKLESVPKVSYIRELIRKDIQENGMKKPVKPYVDKADIRAESLKLVNMINQFLDEN